MSSFFQEGPELKNQFLCDPILLNFLKTKVDGEVMKEIQDDLVSMGEKCSNEYMTLARSACEIPPSVTHYDPWGRRVDEIKVCDAWKRLGDISAREGLVAIGYERKQGEFSRIYQFAKLYLFHPSSAIFTCPLAMTDGAAKLLETIGEGEAMEKAFRKLTSRDPETFWTSGQWMTEKTGGSDVRRGQTVAIKNATDWKLHGVKWFSSATTSQMAMTLAKEEREDGPLSLFYLETHKSDDSLNDIEIMRLKDKLGTKALPTAELKLAGTKAMRVGESGKGVKNISILFNVTRIYNALCAVANMRRIITLSTAYSRKRVAFGKNLIEHPLHRQTLFEAQTEYIGCFHMVFRCAQLLGKTETGKASAKEERLLRLLTPLVKLYTGKRAVETVSEMVESFGGAGYVEDTGIPVILRDTQVLSIWEGTTNILSLDTLRSIAKEDTLSSLFDDIKEMASTGAELEGDATLLQVTKDLQALGKSLMGDESLESKARDYAFALAQVYIGWLLREATLDIGEGELSGVYKKTYWTWLERFGSGLLKSGRSYQIKEEDLVC